MNMNKKMLHLIKDLKKVNYEKEIKVNLNNLQKLFNPNFVQIFDCILFNNKNEIINLSKKDFEEIIKRYTDKTGYESFCSEIRINDYLENEDLSVRELLKISVTVIECWKNKLKLIDNHSKFCFILSCSEGYVTFRFHKIRKGEGMWVCKNLEEYMEPIAYMIL